MATCPSCRTEIEAEAAFCWNCGFRFARAGAAAEDPLVGMVIDGRYRIIDLIGRGGMGAVYRVEHVKMGKIMAVKLLQGEPAADSDLVRRFRREAQAVSQLSHPNNVSVFDFGAAGGLMYLVMEYIDGKDLSEVQRLEGAIPFPRIVEVLIQVCSGLMEAHGKGIVHRDLKPENIIVSRTPDGAEIAKIVDFGLAELRFGKARTRITAQGSLVGTPHYMSPEHIRGEAVDARTDVYALGAMLYKLLTGEPPFSAPTPMGIVTKHLVDPVEPPSRRFPELGIPAEADAIVLKAMAKAPADRYASAEEMRRDLFALLGKLDPGPATARRPAPAFTRSAPAAAPAAEVTPVVTFAPADLRAARPATVTIGAREVELGTRADVDSFRRRRRRRAIVAVLIAAVAALAAAAGALAYLRFGRDDSVPTAETEPNDVPGDADTLTPGVALAGRVAGPAGAAGDVDCFRLRGPERGEWAVALRLSGVAGADLALQIALPGEAAALATANAGGAGAGEEIAPMVVSAPVLYALVQEVVRPGVPQGSFAPPYSLVFDMYDPASVEREPNDALAAATAARVGAPIVGRLGAAGDVDWYCTAAGVGVRSVQASGVPGADLVLLVRVGEGGPESAIDSARGGAGETVSLPQNAGPVCAGVRLRQGGTAAAPGAAYQVLFQ